MKIKKIAELYTSFFRIGILTFGGGLAMLPMFQREIVHDRKWCTDEEVLDMYAISQCTPGIIAVNMATYIGTREAGILGSIFATLGVISPSLIIICLVASILKGFINLPAVQHALVGIRIVVCSLMLNTVYTMIKKGIKDYKGVIIFFITLILALFSPIPTALLVVLSGTAGIVITKFSKKEDK